ncbi:hypothetical protein FB451DRAFT_1195754 [Mycena latifolia]|nr:hypothetical protein FB451DRAFT_1195754 [Mycena latifolia]
MTPKPVLKIWDPQLRPYKDNAWVFKQDIFTDVFAKHHEKTQTRGAGKDVWERLHLVLGSASWVQHLSDWISFYLGGDDLALKLLWKVQLDPDFELYPNGDGPIFIQEDTSPALSMFPSKPHAVNQAEDALPYEWAKNFRDFFEPENEKIRWDKLEVVLDLVEMCKVGRRQYKSEAFQKALERQPWSNPHFRFTHDNAQELLIFISNHP